MRAFTALSLTALVVLASVHEANAVITDPNDDLHILSVDYPGNMFCFVWNLINGEGLLPGGGHKVGSADANCGDIEFRTFATSQAIVTLDLGPLHSVYALRVWNYNDHWSYNRVKGMKDIEVQTSSDRQTWATQGTHVLAMAPGDQSDYSVAFPLTGTARYVRIISSSTHQGTGAREHALSAVKVYGTRLSTPLPAVAVNENDNLHIFSVDAPVNMYCSVWNLINGVGLLPNFGHEESTCNNDFRTYATPQVVVTVDLGPLHSVYALRIWNYNDHWRYNRVKGLKELRIETSTDGASWTSHGDHFLELAPGVQTVDYSQVFALSGNVRYIRLIGNDNHQGPGLREHALSALKVYGTRIDAPVFHPQVLSANELSISAVTSPDPAFCSINNLIGDNGLSSNGAHVLESCGQYAWRSYPRVTVSLTFDLGSNKALGAIKIWTYNHPWNWYHGVKEFKIDTSTDNINWNVAIPHAFLEAVPHGSNVDFGETFSLTGTARYVRLTSLNQHQGNGAREHALSEVKLYADGPFTPEPPTPVPTLEPTYEPTPEPPTGCQASCLHNQCADGLKLDMLLIGEVSTQVWGDQFYTEDSYVAASAVHAGVLAVGESKLVKITCTGTINSFTGTTRNGVTTQDFASPFKSISFDDDTRFTPEPGSTPIPPTAPPLAKSCFQADCVVGKCDVQGVTFDMELTGTTGSIIYGSNIYTDDSHPGVASVHAGVLSVGQTAQVTVSCRGAFATYLGSTAHGVTSTSFGAWPRSFSLALTTNPTPPPPPPYAATTGLSNRCGDANIGTTYRLRVYGANGQAWGTDTYSDDSHLGATATHVGLVALSAQATVVATCQGAVSSLSGSLRNLITTSSYTAYPGSYTLAAASLISPTVCNQKCLNAKCPFSGIEHTLTVTGAATGDAWGSVRYTDDSDVQLAAVHAGLLSVGETKVLAAFCAGGADSFAGSTQNGVTTHDYNDAWGSTFVLTDQNV